MGGCNLCALLRSPAVYTLSGDSDNNDQNSSDAPSRCLQRCLCPSWWNRGGTEDQSVPVHLLGTICHAHTADARVRRVMQVVVTLLQFKTTLIGKRKGTDFFLLAEFSLKRFLHLSLSQILYFLSNHWFYNDLHWLNGWGGTRFMTYPNQSCIITCTVLLYCITVLF